MKTKSIKGSFSDLKPALKSLKSFMESVEEHQDKKPDVEVFQEADLRDIKRVGVGRNG